MSAYEVTPAFADWAKLNGSCRPIPWSEYDAMKHGLKLPSDLDMCVEDIRWLFEEGQDDHRT